MMTRIVHWIRINKLVFFLVAITFIILIIPLLRYGVSGTFFYNLDPDIVYVTNAILYIKSGIVFYADHPGTPSIILFSWLYIPLRFLAKFYFHKDFIQWSFDNIVFLTYYSRIFSLIIFCSGLFVFLKVISKTFRSVYITTFSFLAFFAVMQVQNAISVVPENLSIFLTAVWLYFFTKFISKKSYRLNIILIIISAFAVANKFTSLFLLIPSLLLPIFNNVSFRKRTLQFFINLVISISIFFLGIFPAIGKMAYISDWVRSLLLHTDIYGRGIESVFDLKSYLSSVWTLITGAPIPFAIIFSTLLLGIIYVRNKKLKISGPISFLTFTTFVGIAFFAKYPVIRYFVVDFELIIFCLSYFLSKSKILLAILMSVLLIVPFVEIINIYTIGETARFDPVMAYQQIYIYKNPAKVDTLWGYGVECIYGELYGWTSGWSGNVFGEQFGIKPVLYLNYDLKSIKMLGGSDNKKGVFDVCWDKAYLLSKDVTKFLNMYKDKNLRAIPVPGDDSVYEIDSTHCTMK